MSTSLRKRIGTTAAASLLATMALGLGPLAAPANATTVTSGCLTFEESDTAAVVTSGAACVGAVTVPASVDTKPVVGIGGSAFRYSTTVTSVVIPASVTELYDTALADMPNLTAVTFSPSGTLRTIDGSVFANDPSLTAITLPTTVTSIGGNAFDGDSALASVNLSSLTSLGTIGDYAFQFTAITSVVIPASVTVVGTSAFANCGSLHSAAFAAGSTLAALYNFTFENDPLVTVRLPASVETIGNGSFIGAHFVGLAWPTSLKVIGHFAFQDSWLQSAVLPSGVTDIYERAFMGSAVSFVSLPDTLTSIGDQAFSDTPLVSVDIPGSVASIGWAAFQSDASLVDVNFPQTGVGTLAIGDAAFLGTGLGTLGPIVIPASVASIGNDAFRDISSLTSVQFATTGSLTIGDRAFKNSGLTSLDLPDTLTTIGTDAFQGSSNLADLTFPATGASTMVIGDGAFTGTALTSVALEPVVSYVGSEAFKDVTSLTSLTFPDTGYIAIGASAFKGTGLTGSLAITPAVTGVGDSAFENTTSLTSVTFPATGSVSVGSQAFDGSGITSLTLDASVTAIGDMAFQHTSLTSVSIPASVASIGFKAFYQVGTLTSVTFAATGLTEIGRFAFADTSVGPVELPSTLTTLGIGAFANASHLTSFSLAGPSAAFAVSDGVLFTADGTELVEYPAGRSGAYVVPVVASINPWAFAGAAHLPSVTFAAGGTVSSIPAAAFLMSSLTSITLPATVTAVGYMAFESSHSLTSVRFLGDAPSFDSETFTDTAMGSVYYRPSTTGWDTAFAGPLSGLNPVRMVAPTYGTGDPADQPATVSGRAGVNRKLSAHAGSWASDVAVSTRYAWYSCSKRVSGVSSKLTKGAKCSLIAGQKGSSFKVGKKYKGTYIVAAIRVANEFGSGTVFTGSTAKVK